MMWHSASSCPFPRKRSCAQILGMFSNPPCPVEFGEGPHGAEQVALEGLRTVPAHPGLPSGAEAGPCSRPGTVLSWRMNPEPAPGQHPWLAGAVVQGTCSGQLAASRACPAAPGTSGQRTGDGPRQAQWRGRGGVCQEVLTLQLSRRVLDPGVSKGGVPQEPRVNAQHVWLSRQGRSASPSWVEAGMLLHPKTAPRTPCPREAPWARLGTGAQQPGGHAGPGGVSQEGPSRARLRSWPGRGYPTGNELWDAGAQR